MVRVRPHDVMGGGGGGWRLYNMFQSKPHRVHALRPQVISGPSRQFSLRHLEKKIVYARATFSKQFKVQEL